MGEKVALTTSDGVELAGIYVRPSGAVRAAAVLLHAMPATKESWSPFSERLAGLGLSSLAIDLRGHGESLKKNGLAIDYRLFEDEEHQAKRLDASAAAAWLLDREGFKYDRLAAAGASIGANLAIWLAASHETMPAALALSPGLNYRGLAPELEIPKLRKNQAIFMAASEEDEYSYSSVQEFVKTQTAAARTVRLLKGAGHGTAMFDRDPRFMTEAAEWLAARFTGK